MTDIRPLRWHDLPFAYRIAGHGISFDTMLRLTVGDDILRHALLVGIGRTHTYILKKNNSASLGQLRFSAGQLSARLAYLAPSLDENVSEDVWLSLLDGLSVMAGQHGIANIVAEVDEDSDDLLLLRQAQYGVYTRQEIWVRHKNSVEENELKLRPAQTVDIVGMQSIYNQQIPGLMHQVEPLPEGVESYVLDGNGKLIGMLLIYRGAEQTLCEIYLLEDTQKTAKDMINNMLSLTEGHERTIYCRLRANTRILGTDLEQAGFELSTIQAVMVRHTASHLKHAEFDRVSALDGKRISVPNTFHMEN